MKINKLIVPEPLKVILVEDEFDNLNLTSKEIVVRTQYSHLSAGTELACIAGIEDWFKIPGTPGYTSIAKVESKGSDVNHVEVGDFVYTFGTHSELFKLEYGDRWHGVCVKLPNGINLEHAAFTHMATIAMTAIRNSKIELGDFVLVTGLGAIGNLASQLAQLQGATVIATDIDDHRIALAQQSGIRYAINSKKEDLHKKIEEITNGALVSTYIDATGASAVINENLDNIQLLGEVILLGSPRVPFETNLTKTFQHFHLLPHCLSLKGALEFTYPTHQQDFVKHSLERNASIVLNLINDGKLNIKPIYSHKLSPLDAQSAYDGLKNKPNEYIGVVFDWTKL
jgi:2-desacetyl-2-hydroxyethyl bacteriochlorophyllide A dehydrogenase